jgi:hypothetical protein
VTDRRGGGTYRIEIGLPGHINYHEQKYNYRHQSLIGK